MSTTVMHGISSYYAAFFSYLFKIKPQTNGKDIEWNDNEGSTNCHKILPLKSRYAMYKVITQTQVQRTHPNTKLM